ncbi:hypothetical protein PoB_000259000 [Plakobranchus ocellatus]|uniref:ABC transmembrane type-1 domain-containing protein n=1 Tax=Plakobranchus ocellatus TaxID=259542 RepID=A0AAV3XZ26_9GAST|nr:hypothetical protein PoB_000259000 [Plakobranchus ocellatus]
MVVALMVVAMVVIVMAMAVVMAVARVAVIVAVIVAVMVVVLLMVVMVVAMVEMVFMAIMLARVVVMVVMVVVVVVVVIMVIVIVVVMVVVHSGGWVGLTVDKTNNIGNSRGKSFLKPALNIWSEKKTWDGEKDEGVKVRQGKQEMLHTRVKIAGIFHRRRLRTSNRLRYIMSSAIMHGSRKLDSQESQYGERLHQVFSGENYVL